MRPADAPLGSTRAVVRRNAAAVNATTGRLLPWNPNVAGRVDALRVIGNRVYLGGLFTAVGGRAHANVAAVGRDAGKPTAWHANTNGSVRALEATPGGNLLLGGDFTRVAGAARTRLAEVTPASKVTAWAPRIGQVTGFACPPRCHPTVFTIRMSTNGKTVYFGGHFGLVNDVSRNEAAAVPLANGSTTLAFNPNIYADANCPLCTTPETSRVYNIIPTANPDLHLRWLLEGERLTAVVQRVGVQPDQWRADHRFPRAGRRGHSRLRSARRGPLHRGALQRCRIQLPAEPAAVLHHPPSRGGAGCGHGVGDQLVEPRAPTRSTACWRSQMPPARSPSAATSPASVPPTARESPCIARCRRLLRSPGRSPGRSN